MILEELTITRERFERGTGWAIEPQGACLGEICVPLPDRTDPDTVDVAAVAGRLGMPLVHDAGLWALGPAAPGGTVLSSARAPELELPDLDGTPLRLSSLLGSKVVLVAWAPY